MPILENPSILKSILDEFILLSIWSEIIVIIKKSQVLTALAAATCLSALSMAPVKADLPMSEKAEVMFGHPALVEIEELNPEATVVGRVRGEVGGILSVEFINPDTVTIDDREISRINLPSPGFWVQPGGDIVLAYVDGQWVYVADATRFPFDWLSRLNLKAVPDVQEVSIDWDDNNPVSLPPLAPSTAVEPAPVFAPEPIQGLW